jgi:hypothetical protein
MLGEDGGDIGESYIRVVLHLLPKIVCREMEGEFTKLERYFALSAARIATLKHKFQALRGYLPVGWLR